MIPPEPPAGPIRFVFLELTNHCNFDCTFCPNGVMTRPRRFMDVSLAFRLLAEIAEERLAAEPIQLHVMGEPFLHPRLFDILAFMRQKRLPVRLFTNGALLHAANRERLFQADVEELVIGIQTISEETYRDHRRGRPDYRTYLQQIRDTIEAKFDRGATTRIELHFMNTKHFNEFRDGKGYPATRLPLVDDNQKAFAIIDEWKDFGRRVSEKHRLGHQPVDLEGLRGAYRDDPLGCVRGNHCEILPGVIIGFKEIGTFCDYLVNPIRFVERYQSDCSALNEQLAVLASGDCTLCCVDYDGKMAVGNVAQGRLADVWNSPAVRALQEANAGGRFPTEVCRVCRAFQVVDDYGRKFPGREGDPFDLERGWYPLEQAGPESFRWVGKRARLALGADAVRVGLTVKPGHPGRPVTTLAVRQGRRETRYALPAGEWTSLVFETGPIDRDGATIEVESEEFWVPASEIPGSDDRRELSVMIRDVEVTAPEAQGRLRRTLRNLVGRSIPLLPSPGPSRPSTRR